MPHKHKPCPVKIQTGPIDGDIESVKLKSVDWNNSSDRKWLMSHMHWAFHNQQAIAIVPESL